MARIVQNKCKFCGKYFITKTRVSYNNGNIQYYGSNIYCSRECSAKYIESKIVYVNCEKCGKLFSVKRNKSNFGLIRFCSKECYVKDGYIPVHLLVRKAIKDGYLIKQPCENCGSEKDICAHHEDYSRPLEVTWLCRTCHSRRHINRFMNEPKPRLP